MHGKENTSFGAAWQPNLNAPEFIPTLTMQCPIVGICHMSASGATQSAEPSFFTPEKCREPSPSAGGRRRHGGKKRRTSSMQDLASAAPSQKRTKSEERECSQRAQLRVSVPCEEATEEDWQRRAEMRQKAIDIVKKFPEYRWYSEVKHEDDPPMTPDPKDRGISKRRWKYLTAQWRLALKQRYIEDGHGSVAGTEEMMTTISTEDTEGIRAFEADDGSNL